jgi:hypothetical protein
MRLGGVSGGEEIHGWRDCSHTAMVGAGKFGSAKLPMETNVAQTKPLVWANNDAYHLEAKGIIK